jgi:hypothetical protein
VARQPGVHFVPNWTSAAGALEGILEALGTPLPRHAIMGLSGHAWQFRLGSAEGIVALPSGPLDLDWEAMAAHYKRLGWRWERFGARLEPGRDWQAARDAAVAWAAPHLERGHPVLGFDFHLREFGIVFGYDAAARAWLVDDLLAGDYGPAVPLDTWPGEPGWLELIAPVEPIEVDPIDAIGAALDAATRFIAGDGSGLSGAPGIDSWAEAFEGETVVDRAGNAYTLAVLLAARSDGAAFVADVAESLPPIAEPLGLAKAALGDEVRALAPLVSLFPFPAGGHGNVDVPGLRRAAAMALRQASAAERRTAEHLAAAVEILRGE